MAVRRGHGDCKGGQCEVLRGARCGRWKGKAWGRRMENAWLFDAVVATMVVVLGVVFWWLESRELVTAMPITVLPIIVYLRTAVHDLSKELAIWQ